MSLPEIDNLKHALKELIIRECQKEDDFAAAEIADDEPLIGPDSRVALDSLDTLQVSMAVSRQYGVRIQGVKEGRIALASVSALADYISQHSK